MFGTSPPIDLQANGAAERAVRELMSQFRRVKLRFERRIESTIAHDHPIIDWAIQHSGFFITKFLKGSQDGFTAHRRLHGREHRGELVEFEEWRMCVGKAKEKR